MTQKHVFMYVWDAYYGINLIKQHFLNKLQLLGSTVEVKKLTNNSLSLLHLGWRLFPEEAPLHPLFRISKLHGEE